MNFLPTGDKSRAETAEREPTAAVSLMLSFSVPGFCKQKTNFTPQMRPNVPGD